MVVYGLSPTYLQEFLCFKDSSSYNFMYSNLLEIPRTKSTMYGTNNFRFQAATLWNSLPDKAKKITTSSRPGTVHRVNAPYISKIFNFPFNLFSLPCQHSPAGKV